MVVARRLPDEFPGCDHCATTFLAEPVRLPILLCTPHYDDAAEILRETWRRKLESTDRDQPH